MESIIKDILKIRDFYRYMGLFIENGKWKKLIFHPILAFGIYFLRGMVGAFYLINQK
jgi:hypothetical protein